MLAPELLLVLLVLGCWLGREAVMPADVVRWALSGQLPFLDLPSRSHRLLREAPLDLPTAVLEPRGTALHVVLFAVWRIRLLTTRGVGPIS